MAWNFQLGTDGQYSLMTYNGRPLIQFNEDESMVIPLLNLPSGNRAMLTAGTESEDEHELIASTSAATAGSLPLPDVALLTDCIALLSTSPPISPRIKDKESTPLLVHTPDGLHDNFVDFNNFPDDQDYQNLLYEAEQAIEHGVCPQRISQGSSGSYFVKNREGVRAGPYYRYLLQCLELDYRYWVLL